MAQVNKIVFNYMVPRFHFEHRNALKKFINLLFLTEKVQINSLHYIFCSDKFLLELNKKYLHHNWYTDIISFDLSEKPKEVLGEVYISIDRIKINAQRFKTSFNLELHRVIFHGALHLCGYNDKKEAQIREIRNKENKYLNKYFVSRENI